MGNCEVYISVPIKFNLMTYEFHCSSSTGRNEIISNCIIFQYKPCVKKVINIETAITGLPM